MICIKCDYWSKWIGACQITEKKYCNEDCEYYTSKFEYAKDEYREEYEEYEER